MLHIENAWSRNVALSQEYYSIIESNKSAGWAGINCGGDCKQFATLIASEMRTILGKPSRREEKEQLLSFEARDLNPRFTAQLIPQGELHFLPWPSKQKDLRSRKVRWTIWEDNGGMGSSSSGENRRGETDSKSWRNSEGSPAVGLSTIAKGSTLSLHKCNADESKPLLILR